MIYLLFILATGWSITSKDRLFFRNMMYDIRPNALFILKKDYQLILVLAHFGNLILLKEKKLENQFPSNLFLINESKVNRCSFYQNQKEIEYHLRDSLQLVVTPSMSYRDSRFWKKSRMQSVRFFFLKKSAMFANQIFVNHFITVIWWISSYFAPAKKKKKPINANIETLRIQNR